MRFSGWIVLIFLPVNGFSFCHGAQVLVQQVKVQGSGQVKIHAAVHIPALLLDGEVVVILGNDGHHIGRQQAAE